jgi:hypothetical protein
MSKTQRISYFELEELVRVILNIPDDTEMDLDDLLCENFGCDTEVFGKIVNALLPMAMVGTSPLSKKNYQGFAKDGIFFIKRLLPVCPTVEKTAKDE